MKLGFWTLFGLAVAMRLALVWQTSFAPTIRPIPAYNDEPAHFNYVRYVAVHRALPVQQSSVQEGVEKGEYEYYQAPLYYLLAWPIYIMGQTLTPGGELSWVRSISALFSLGGILVLYLAVRRFFEQEIIALPVLLLGALSAIPTRFGSLVTNDSLFFALACLNFALLLEILHQGCDGRLWVAGILVSAAGLWTKASFLLLLPLLPATILFSSIAPSRRGLKSLASLLLPLIAILPWYLHNRAQYGHFLPLSAGFGPPDLLNAGNLASRLEILGNYFTRSLVFPYDQFWGGLFDFLIFPLAGLAFLIFVLLGFMALWQKQRGRFWLFLSAVGIVALGYIYLNYQYSQAEARYLLPAFPFLLVLLALGADRLAGKKKGRALLWLGLWIAIPWLTALT